MIRSTDSGTRGPGREWAPAQAYTRLRAVELWIPAAISLVVGLRWLLGERHSIYGDEAFHLTNLFNGVASAAQGGLRERFVNLYLFNFAYPPVFHLLAVPFVLYSADPVIAGRVFAQVLTLLVAISLYAVTRDVGGKLAGAISVATLLGTPSFVDVSRHYLLESLLTVEVVALLIVLGHYVRVGERRYLWLMSGIISAGLLTKFNFFLYAAPLFIAPIAIELSRWVGYRQDGAIALRSAAIVAAVPLMIAGPWYLARATGPMSAIGMLSGLYEAGTLQAGLSLTRFLELAVDHLFWNYSLLLVGLAVVAALVYGAHVMGVRVARTLLRPMSLPQHAIVAGAFASAVCVPILLALLGLGRGGSAAELRWHVEAVCLLIATFGVIGTIRHVALRLLVTGAAGVGAALQLVSIYVAPVSVPMLLRVPDSALTPRPSIVAVGSEALAHDLASHEKRLGGSKPGEFAYFLYHEHGGPHFGSVEFYLRFFEQSPLAGRIAGFNNRAIELDNIFGAKYLIDEVPGQAAEWQDPENQRYRRLAERLPPAFRSLWVDVSDVEGRFGRFKAYYVPRERITADMVLETIESGRKLETVEPFLVLWDAQRVIWRAKFETLPQNASLQEEIDALRSRIPIAEASLSAINRQLLHDYVARIDDIQRSIGAARAAPAAGSN